MNLKFLKTCFIFLLVINFTQMCSSRMQSLDTLLDRTPLMNCLLENVILMGEQVDCVREFEVSQKHKPLCNKLSETILDLVFHKQLCIDLRRPVLISRCIHGVQLNLSRIFGISPKSMVQKDFFFELTTKLTHLLANFKIYQRRVSFGAPVQVDNGFDGELRVSGNVIMPIGNVASSLGAKAGNIAYSRSAIKNKRRVDLSNLMHPLIIFNEQEEVVNDQEEDSDEFADKLGILNGPDHVLDLLQNKNRPSHTFISLNQINPQIKPHIFLNQPNVIEVQEPSTSIFQHDNTIQIVNSELLKSVTGLVRPCNETEEQKDNYEENDKIAEELAYHLPSKEIKVPRRNPFYGHTTLAYGSIASINLIDLLDQLEKRDSLNDSSYYVLSSFDNDHEIMPSLKPESSNPDFAMLRNFELNMDAPLDVQLEKSKIEAKIIQRHSDENELINQSFPKLEPDITEEETSDMNNLEVTGQQKVPKLSSSLEDHIQHKLTKIKSNFNFVMHRSKSKIIPDLHVNISDKKEKHVETKDELTLEENVASENEPEENKIKSKEPETIVLSNDKQEDKIEVIENTSQENLDEENKKVSENNLEINKNSPSDTGLNINKGSDESSIKQKIDKNTLLFEKNNANIPEEKSEINKKIKNDENENAAEIIPVVLKTPRSKGVSFEDVENKSVSEINNKHGSYGEEVPRKQFQKKTKQNLLKQNSVKFSDLYLNKENLKASNENIIAQINKKETQEKTWYDDIGSFFKAMF